MHTMERSNIAVITGDLINSSGLGPETTIALMERLTEEFKSYSEDQIEPEISFTIMRGDSFQGIVVDISKALEVALKIKTLVNGFTKTISKAANSKPVADVRISIGIGSATYDLNAINKSNGEAFEHSGRILDGMKKTQRKMVITTASESLNDEFSVYMKFLDYLTDHWSVASAEVVYFLLQGKKEREIANKLQRSQAAVNLRKKAAGWEEITTLLKRYDQLITQNYE